LKISHDKALCLHITAAALHNQADDEQAQHLYEAALQFHPPFAKDLYLRLHHIFIATKIHDSFQALKQALYLERSGDDEPVTRLTHLGWHYDRLEELIMTLRFLLGNNEENQTIRRSLAFSLAHAIILHHRQSGDEVNMPPSETDLQIVRMALPDPASLDALTKVRDYCTLQLALLLAEKTRRDTLTQPLRRKIKIAPRPCAMKLSRRTSAPKLLIIARCSTNCRWKNCWLRLHRRNHRSRSILQPNRARPILTGNKISSVVCRPMERRPAN
jgi:hypothetical protein